MRSYEPAEFVSIMASNQQLDEPMDLAIYGLVKPDESDSSVLLLSISTSCERWIPIPVSLISSVEHGGNVSCKDHEHPFVRIVLAEANKDDVSAVLFMRLFVQANARAAAARVKAASDRSGGCETFTFNGKPMVCCPPASGSGSWDCFTML